MRLREGRHAPGVAGTSITGQTLALSDLHGQNVLLKFYRFAACPICNLHLREYVRRAGDLAEAGITVLAVFHSPDRKMRKSLSKLSLPFAVIADPEKRWFKAYGVEDSWRGMFSWRVWRDYARAMAAGFMTRPFLHEGGIRGIPADFLIDTQGVVRFAHYGRDYADSLSVDSVLAIAKERDLSAQRLAVSR